MKFDAFGISKHGEGKSLSKTIVLLCLSVHWGDLSEQIKEKNCHIHFKDLNPLPVDLEVNLVTLRRINSKVTLLLYFMLEIWKPVSNSHMKRQGILVGKFVFNS